MSERPDPRMFPRTYAATGLLLALLGFIGVLASYWLIDDTETAVQALVIVHAGGIVVVAMILYAVVHAVTYRNGDMVDFSDLDPEEQEAIRDFEAYPSDKEGRRG